MAKLANGFPGGQMAFFFVFVRIPSKRRVRTGRSVNEVMTEIMMPFIRTMPISNPIWKDINRSASNPAIVVNDEADIGLITALMDSFIASSLLEIVFFLSRYS